MLRPSRKVKKCKNQFSVNLKNLLYTFFSESTVYQRKTRQLSAKIGEGKFIIDWRKVMSINYQLEFKR